MTSVIRAPEPWEWTSLEELCDRYLVGRLASATLETLRPLERQRPEVRDFLRRVFQLMNIAGLTAKDVSPLFAAALVATPGFLPGAWNGVVPPITRPGRHRRIDDYISSQSWQQFGAGTVVIDVGCGFPPQTAVDTAVRFPTWQVVGVDPAFDPFLLYAGTELYACVSADGHIRYFGRQPNADADGFLKRLVDRDSTVRWLSELFITLLPKLPSGHENEMAIAEANGCRLIRWPLKQWESSNLRFIQAGIGSRELPPADLIRCFNVLFYYGASVRRDFETWAVGVLNDGGLAITGCNNPNSTEARYEVYRREGDALIEKEFAFSIDNLRPSGLVSWFSMADDEPTSLRLAQLVGLIRSDAKFRSAFDQRLDELLRIHQVMVRGADGYLTWAASDALQRAFTIETGMAILDQLDRAGFTDEACHVLLRCGLTARRNDTGCVSIEPTEFENATCIQ